MFGYQVADLALAPVTQLRLVRLPAAKVSNTTFNKKAGTLWVSLFSSAGIEHLKKILKDTILDVDVMVWQAQAISFFPHAEVSLRHGLNPLTELFHVRTWRWHINAWTNSSHPEDYGCST